MKILQINNVYDFGSTGKITRDIHHGLLERGYDSVVYYGRRYKTDDKNVHKICSEFYGKAQNGLYQITGIKYGGCYLSTSRLISAIKKEKPIVFYISVFVSLLFVIFASPVVRLLYGEAYMPSSKASEYSEEGEVSYR